MARKTHNCAWCHKTTTLPEVFAAEGPLLDWMEERMNKYCEKKGITRLELWGEESDWNKINLDENMEAELLAYDELVTSVSRKHICKECLIEDDKIYKKYYLKDFPDDDMELTIDDLK